MNSPKGSEVEPSPSNIDGERDRLRHRATGRFTLEEFSLFSICSYWSAAFTT
jgi:hypothetical protein